MLLAGCPTVSTVAILVWYEYGSSLVSTDEVEITLTLTTELQVTLVQDIVKCSGIIACQTGTGTYLVEVFQRLCGTATCSEQQLGSIQQGLSIAVDAFVIVVVQVLGSRTVLVVV